MISIGTDWLSLCGVVHRLNWDNGDRLLLLGVLCDSDNSVPTITTAATHSIRSHAPQIVSIFHFSVHLNECATRAETGTTTVATPSVDVVETGSNVPVGFHCAETDGQVLFEKIKT